MDINVRDTCCMPLQFDFDLDPAIIQRVKKDNTDLSPSYSNLLKLYEHEQDANLLKLLSTVGMCICYQEAFYTAPGLETTLHIDGITQHNNAKINWIYGGSGSTMKWWKRIDPSAPIHPHVTPHGNKAVRFSQQECVLIHEEPISSPCLLNVGMIHNVHNKSPEGRWCLSWLLQDLDTKKVVQWDDARNRLQAYAK